MRTGNYTDGEYLTAAVVNLGFQDGTAAAQEAVGLNLLPGLIRPDAAAWSVSGLTVSVSLPRPFLAAFASGIVCAGHGTVAGTDSPAYSVSLSSLIPGTGTSLVYLTVSSGTVPQSPISIVGPPPGNPAYNPGFVPFTAYQESWGTVQVAAGTGVPDGQTVLELARTTLSAGQTGISLAALSFGSQTLAAEMPAAQTVQVSASVALGPAQAGPVQTVTVSGTTLSLPSASGAYGLPFLFHGGFAAGYATVQANGSDIISGLGGPGSPAISAISLLPGMDLALRSASGAWQAWASSDSAPLVWQASGSPAVPVSYSASGGLAVPSSGSFTGSLTAAYAATSGQVPAAAQVSGMFLAEHVFSTAGTGLYTPTPGTQSAKFWLCGGGAGGGGAGIPSGGTVVVSPGGTCGAYGEGILSISALGTGQVITVGAGGVTTVGASGAPGGQSSIGTLAIASGGLGAVGIVGTPPTVNGNGAITALPSGCTTYAVGGIAGEPGIALSTTAGLGGNGGSTPWGRGGLGTVMNGAPMAAQGFGAGGAGVVVNSSVGSSTAGANGAPGIVIIWDFGRPTV